MGTASTTPRPAGEPRNRAGEEKVGGARPPALGGFHLNSASCVCILTLPPPQAWFGGCVTSNMSEVVRISHYLTRHPHCMGKLRPKETQGINLLESRSLRSQAFPPNLKVPFSVSPRCYAPALASYASTDSRPSGPAPSQPGLPGPWPPAASRSSHALPGAPSQTSQLQRFYGNSLLPPPFSPRGLSYHFQGLSPEAPALTPQSSQMVTARRAVTV